jgi:hypothetical protein
VIATLHREALMFSNINFKLAFALLGSGFLVGSGNAGIRREVQGSIWNRANSSKPLMPPCAAHGPRYPRHFMPTHYMGAPFWHRPAAPKRRW